MLTWINCLVRASVRLHHWGLGFLKWGSILWPSRSVTARLPLPLFLSHKLCVFEPSAFSNLHQVTQFNEGKQKHDLYSKGSFGCLCASSVLINKALKELIVQAPITDNMLCRGCKRFFICHHRWIYILVFTNSAGAHFPSSSLGLGL